MTRTANMPQERVHVLYETKSDSLRHLLRESLWEWVAVVCLLGFSGGLEFIDPFQRVAFAEDLKIVYPLRTQTVPSWMLGVLAAIVPLVVILFTSIFVKRSVFDAHMSTLGLAVSLVFTLIFTQIVKIAVGSLRPDFLARCQPVWKYDDMLTVTMVDRCTGDAGDIKEGRKSFFSGHSSMAWSGLGFLAIYLAGRLNLDRKPLAPKYAVVTIPIVVALLISISRVDDYWHRWEDVVVGAVVGATISAWSYSYHCTIAESVVTGDDRSASGIDDTHSSQHRGSTLTQEGSHERLRPGARVSSHRQSTGDVNIAVDDESQTAGGNIRQNNRLEQRNGSFFRS